MDLRSILEKSAEEEYRIFAKKLLPKDTDLLGVRLPLLKKIAKEELAENGLSFLKQANYGIFEEKLLCGFLIAYWKKPILEKIPLITDFVTKIDSWSVCDSFCAALHPKKSELAGLLDYLETYIDSENEYECRFALVMLLDYFINFEYIDRTLMLIKKAGSVGYYTKMAQAWALSVCMVHFPDKTKAILEERSLDTFVKKKAIQKCIESYRINIDTKIYLKDLL